MSRFMKVKGKPGLLVADPFRARGVTPHFLGMQEKSPPPVVDTKDPIPLADFYEPCEQVVECDDLQKRAHVLDAKKNGELEVLGECTAPNRSAAELKMTVKPPAKSGKAGE